MTKFITLTLLPLLTVALYAQEAASPDLTALNALKESDRQFLNSVAPAPVPTAATAKPEPAPSVRPTPPPAVERERPKVVRSQPAEKKPTAKTDRSPRNKRVVEFRTPRIPRALPVSDSRVYFQVSSKPRISFATTPWVTRVTTTTVTTRADRDEDEDEDDD